MFTAKLLRDASWVLLGDVLSRIPFLISEIIIAMQLGPAVYPFWISIQLLVNYNNFSQLGALSGLSKLEPRYRRNSSGIKLNRLLSGTFIVMILASLGYWLFVWLLVILSESFSYLSDMLPFLLFLFCIQQVFLYGQSRLRNLKMFKEATVWRVFYSIVFLFFVLLWGQISIESLAVIWGLAFSISSLIFIYFYKIYIPFVFSFKYSKYFVLVGFSLFLNGFIKFFLVSIDKFFVSTLGVSDDSGLYTINYHPMLILSLLFGVFGKVLMPRVFEDQRNIRKTSDSWDSYYFNAIMLGCFVSSIFVHFFAVFKELLLPAFSGGEFYSLFLISSGFMQGLFVTILVVFSVKSKEGALNLLMASFSIAFIVFLFAAQGIGLIYVALFSVAIWAFLLLAQFYLLGLGFKFLLKVVVCFIIFFAVNSFLIHSESITNLYSLFISIAFSIVFLLFIYSIRRYEFKH